MNYPSSFVQLLPFALHPPETFAEATSIFSIMCRYERAEIWGSKTIQISSLRLESNLKMKSSDAINCQER